MNRLVAFVLMAAGAVLLFFGINAMESAGSEISQFFTGEPSDRAMWYMIGGALLAALGIGAFFLPRRA